VALLSASQSYQPCLNLALAPPRDTSPSFAVADPGLGSQPTQGYQPFLSLLPTLGWDPSLPRDTSPSFAVADPGLVSQPALPCLLL